MIRQTIWHYFKEIGVCFNFWPILNSKGQLRQSWECHNIRHIRKMLFMLLLDSVLSLTVLTFCAQCMGSAALKSAGSKGHIVSMKHARFETIIMEFTFVFVQTLSFYLALVCSVSPSQRPHQNVVSYTRISLNMKE